MKKNSERQHPQQTEPRVATPGPIENPNAGEIVVDKADRDYIAEAVAAVKGAVKNVIGGGKRPLMDGLGRIVEADPDTLDPIERHNLLPLASGQPGVRVLRQMWRAAMEKRAQAANILRAADERLAAIKALAAADGMAREYSLLGAPKPAEPERPKLVRIRSDAPWRRLYHRTVSPELALWLRVNEDITEDRLADRFPPRDIRSAGKGHVHLVPEEIAADVVSAGLAQYAGDDVPLQLPSGQRI